MALGAFQTRMSALQWVCAQGMFLHCERGGFPAIYGVARATFSAIRTFGKLAIVGIGLVAIYALLEYERLLEISIGMAQAAIHAAVFALQGELCLGVIEALIQRLGRDLLPTARVVAGLAGLPGKASTVRVLVAVRALGERNPCVLWFAIGAIGMTLRALHLGVQPGQRIAGLRVIELSNADILPAFKIMALLARRTEAALVGILVTTAACG